jgi:hypothetical protein
MDEKKNQTVISSAPVDAPGAGVKGKIDGVTTSVYDADDALLAELGYKSEFKVG